LIVITNRGDENVIGVIIVTKIVLYFFT